MMLEGLLGDVFRPVDRSWSRDTAVARLLLRQS